MSYLYFALTRKQNLGWIEVKANVPGALIFLDSKDVGAVGKTPYSGHLRPGMRKIIVERDGYEPITKEMEIVAGKTHVVEVKLVRVRHGWIKVSGETTQGAVIKVDGKRFACSGFPCRGAVPTGRHIVSVDRPDFKPYSKEIYVNQAEEVQLRVRLNPKPSRLSAYITLGIAGALLGAGIGAGIYSSNQSDSLQQDLANGVLYDANDSRIDKGRISAIVANSLYGVSGLVAILGVYYLFRDEGPDSYGDTQRTNLAITPSLSPQMAGVTGQVRF